MNYIKILSAIVLSLLLSVLLGCGGTSEKKPEEKTKPKVTNPVDGYVKAIDKAKDAEKKILEAAEKQRKAIEALEKGKKPSTDDN